VPYGVIARLVQLAFMLRSIVCRDAAGISGRPGIHRRKMMLLEPDRSENQANSAASRESHAS